jgi:ribosomal protein S18 acetylase RimI-like enzyme
MESGSAYAQEKSMLLENDAIKTAALCVAAALENDPFYHTITADRAENRRAVLADYVEYSIREAQQHGFVTLAEGDKGAAIWLKPLEASIAEQAQAAKEAYFAGLLGENGLRTYRNLIEVMAPQAEALIDPAAWYLSILGVCPDQQGKGLGAALLRPVLALADEQRVPCFVESDNRRNLAFYERAGFVLVSEYTDPATSLEFSILIRPPQPA